MESSRYMSAMPISLGGRAIDSDFAWWNGMSSGILYIVVSLLDIGSNILL